MAIREYMDGDLVHIERIFAKSVMSILPSLWALIIPQILLFCGFKWIAPMLFVLGAIIYMAGLLYLNQYIINTSPAKHIKLYTNNPHSKILVLYLPHNHKIIGFVSYLGNIYTKSCWITHQFVDPYYQKMGYGAQLNDALFEYAYCSAGYTTVAGGTSSIQTSQLKLHKKYIKTKPEWKLEFIHLPPPYKYIPIHQINIVYTI